MRTPVLQDVLDAASVGFIIVDEKQEIVVWNTWMETVSGISKGGAMGKTLDGLFPGQISQRLKVAVESALTQGISSHLSQKLNRKLLPLFTTGENGQDPLPVEQTVVIRPVSVVEEGNYCLLQVTDISMAVSRETLLKQAKNEADRASLAKSEFLSSMSHELRTPMNAILGFGQMLSLIPNDPLSEVQQKCVDHIMEGGQHLLELINDVLDLAKIETGNVELYLEDVSPGDILDKCLPLIQGQADERGIGISIAGAQKKSPTVRADHTRFQQVFLNLLSNAVKYNRDGGKIIIDFDEGDEGMFRMSVSDTGSGIPTKDQHKLFQPFNRLGAENSEIEGTGIGLVVSKDLVEMMNGTIGFESKPGKGCTFWIELPLS